MTRAARRWHWRVSAPCSARSRGGIGSRSPDSSPACPTSASRGREGQGGTPANAWSVRGRLDRRPKRNSGKVIAVLPLKAELAHRLGKSAGLPTNGRRLPRADAGCTEMRPRSRWAARVPRARFGRAARRGVEALSSCSLRKARSTTVAASIGTRSTWRCSPSSTCSSSSPTSRDARSCVRWVASWTQRTTSPAAGSIAGST